MACRKTLYKYTGILWGYFIEKIMFRGLTKCISKVNTKNKESFQYLRHLKGESFFDTFFNVKSFNNLQLIKKEVKLLKTKVEKLPKEISKIEQRQIKLKQKAKNEEIQQPFFQAIKDAEIMKRGERNIRINEIRQSIFEQQLLLKQDNGESISSFDRLKLNNPKLRVAEKFIKSKIYAALMLNVFNYKEIEEANDDIGFMAALEEIGKNTAMIFLGLTALKYTNTQLKNTITALSLYSPAGRFLKGLSTPSAILLSLTVKPILDKLWVTQYEKAMSE